MECITYRKTLDVHKNGVQFLLQGFETADKLSRVIEISLMASGDALDFPLERMVAMMYVTTPGATEPSINECTIKDNKVVYETLPIIIEGITTMQLKLIETSPQGATSVLASPKFAVEVTESDADDGSAEQSTTFTALEDAVSKAKTVYDERFLRMELSSDCIFRAYYADGTVYETNLLQRLFLNGNTLLSESFAHGGTGVRAGEDTDNSMYYSNVSRSEALNAKAIMENSEEILEEVKLHGVYTAFSVDFETGNVEYVSPSFKFRVNLETGELEAEGQTYTFEDELSRVIADWLAENGVILSDLQAISTTHTEEIAELKEITSTHTEEIGTLKSRVTPIELGGTGVTTLADLKNMLTIDNLTSIPSYLTFVGNVNANMVEAAFGKNNEDNIKGVGRALAMYIQYNEPSTNIESLPDLVECNTLLEIAQNRNATINLINSPHCLSLVFGNSYASGVFGVAEVDTISASLEVDGDTTKESETLNFTVTEEMLSNRHKIGFLDITTTSVHHDATCTCYINNVKMPFEIKAPLSGKKKIAFCFEDYRINSPGTYALTWESESLSYSSYGVTLTTTISSI